MWGPAAEEPTAQPVVESGGFEVTETLLGDPAAQAAYGASEEPPAAAAAGGAGLFGGCMAPQLSDDEAAEGGAVRHCRCLVFPLPLWLRHCRCLVFPLPLWLRHCRCLVFPLPLWLRHCLCFVFPLQLGEPEIEDPDADANRPSVGGGGGMFGACKSAGPDSGDADSAAQPPSDSDSTAVLHTVAMGAGAVLAAPFVLVAAVAAAPVVAVVAMANAGSVAAPDGLAAVSEMSMETRFEKYDTDGNGQLDKSELHAMMIGALPRNPKISSPAWVFRMRRCNLTLRSGARRPRVREAGRRVPRKARAGLRSRCVRRVFESPAVHNSPSSSATSAMPAVRPVSDRFSPYSADQSPPPQPF